VTTRRACEGRSGLIDRSVGVYVHEANSFAIWILLPDNRAFLTLGVPPVPSGMPLETVGEIVGPDGTPTSPN
jgi:hypothetical protein